MTMHSVSGSHNTLNAMKTDFSNFTTQFNALQSALNSGNQAQVQSSKSSFSTTLHQVISDLSAVSQGQAAGSGNQVKNVGSGSRTLNLQNDLQTLQNALDSVNTSKGNSSQNSLESAMSKVQTDMKGLQKNHGHHQNHGATATVSNSGKGGAGNDTISALAALFGNSGQTQNNTGSVNIQA